MSKHSLFNLYEETIEDIYTLILTKVSQNQLDENKADKIPKIDLVIGIISNSEVSDPLKVGIKNLLKIYFGNVKEFMDNKLDYKISDDDLYQSYAALFGYNFVFNYTDENSFKSFDYNNYPKFADFLNKSSDNLTKKKNIYSEKFKFFSKSNENISNLNFRWIKLLFEKDLSSISSIKKRKNKKKDVTTFSPKKDEKIYSYNSGENVGSFWNNSKNNFNNNVIENSEKENSIIEGIEEQSHNFDDDNQLFNPNEDKNKSRKYLYIILPEKCQKNTEIKSNTNKINDLIKKMDNLKDLTENEKLLFSILKLIREEFSERIETLEKHQLLQYHQSTLY